MASIAKRPDGKYRAKYYAPDGKEHARHFARKVDAQHWLDGVSGDIVRGDYIDPKAGKQTFGDYARAWQKAQVHRPTTAAQLGTHLKRHVLPTFENRPLSSIRPSEVQAWVKGRADVLAPSTVEVVYRWFSTIMRAAVQDGLLRVSPCRGVKLPKKDRPPVVPISVETVRALVDATDPRYRAMVVLAAGTGLRQGECFGLGIEHVDFLRRQVRVERQVVKVQGRPPFLAPPKTAASFRTVPLPDVVLDALSAHLAAYPVGESGLIFPGEDGGPLSRMTFGSNVWRPAVKKATGVPDDGVGFHQLRHFYASLLIQAGESVKVVQSRLGHASAVETLNTYSHLWPDSEDRTRTAVDLVLGDSRDYSGTAEVAAT
jgi:integrase